MEKNLKNKFIEDTDSLSKEAFNLYIGSENHWFSDFLYALKLDWIDKGFQISDILIRENKTILVAPIKTYIPFKSESYKIGTPSKKKINDITSCFTGKVPKEGDIYEFSFLVSGLGIFRISYSHDENGVGLSIRYLTFKIPTFEDMSYPSFYENFVKSMVGKNNINTPSGVHLVGNLKSGGLVLHIGATGQGKTTSIAAEVGYFAENTTGAIVTYENPIEYRYIATQAPVRQYEIGIDILKTENLTEFQSIKRHLLRNNPSLVMIGEARNNEEIRETLDIAARGHLVLGTIHSSSVMECLTHLIGLTREEPHLLAQTLHAIIAHKLFTNSKGVIIPIYEILIPNTVIKTHIAKGDIKAIASLFVSGEMKGEFIVTFADSLNEALKEGKFTPAEATQIRNSSYGSFKK